MADETIVKEEPKVAEVKNLKSVIEDAAAAVAIEVGDKIEKEEAAASKEEVKEEVKEEKKEELTADQLQFVTNLFKGLNNPDPKIQIGTLKILANAAGMDLKAIETKTEVKEAEETLTALLKEGLGEFDFLAEKLGPVLEKVLEKAIDKHTKPVKETLESQRLETIKADIDRRFESVVNEFDNAKDLIKDVEKLMDSLSPSKNTTPEVYFRSLFRIAASEKNINLKTKGSVDETKTTRNRNDAMTRLASGRGTEVKEVERTPQRMSLKEAVRDAATKTAEALAQGKK